jgi:hypothetical protein
MKKEQYQALLTAMIAVPDLETVTPDQIVSALRTLQLQRAAWIFSCDVDEDDYLELDPMVDGTCHFHVNGDDRKQSVILSPENLRRLEGAIHSIRQGPPDE